MLWRAEQFMWGVVLVLLIGASALAGCSHAGRHTLPTQPFREESEPSDDFQYHEGAVPAGDGDGKAAGGESTDETTVEIEIDESSGAAVSADDAGSGVTSEGGDEGDDEGDDGASDGEGDDGEGDDGDDATSGGEPGGDEPGGDPRR